MIRRHLMGTRYVALEDSDVKLNYYMIENELKENYVLYGVEVEKGPNLSHADHFKESEIIQSLTDDQCLAKEILNKLIQHSVTPIGLVESVDTLYSMME